MSIQYLVATNLHDKKKSVNYYNFKIITHFLKIYIYFLCSIVPHDGVILLNAFVRISDMETEHHLIFPLFVLDLLCTKIPRLDASHNGENWQLVWKKQCRKKNVKIVRGSTSKMTTDFFFFSMIFVPTSS